MNVEYTTLLKLYKTVKTGENVKVRLEEAGLEDVI